MKVAGFFMYALGWLRETIYLLVGITSSRDEKKKERKTKQNRKKTGKGGRKNP